jgi:hypothetical protein
MAWQGRIQTLIGRAQTTADIAKRRADQALAHSSSATLGFHAGGFRRLQSTPVVDRSAQLRGFRDPGVYCEYVDGMREFTVVAAMPEQSGTNAQFQNVGCAVGPSLTQLTYQGEVINRAQLAGQLPGGANCDKLGVSGIAKEGSTYHQFVVAWEHDLPTTTTGGIAHFTAPSAQGPWTFAGWALTPDAASSELLPMDNCVPIWYKGEWVMAFSSLKADRVTRPLKFATAPTLNSPWTRVVSTVTLRGGYAAADGSVDSPMLVVEGDQLVCFVNPNSYFLEAYDFTKFKSAAYDGVPLGKVFGVSAPVGTAGDLEAGAPSWGGGGICRIDNDVYFVYWGLEVTDAANKYPKTFAAQWVPGRHYVPTAPISVVAGKQLGTSDAAGTIDLPTWLPQEAYAVDLQVNFRETGAVPAPNASGPVERLEITGTATLDTVSGYLAPTATNMTNSQRVTVPVHAGGVKRLEYALTGAPGTNTGRLTVTLLGYWRAP